MKRLCSLLYAAFLFFPGCSNRDVPMESLIPLRFDGWEQYDDDGKFDRETIFTFMDGAGEIYRMYSFKSLLVRQFRKDAMDITVELYDMQIPTDAYGIFSHLREIPEGTVGQGSLYEEGYLYFWKDKYLCQVHTLSTEKAAVQSVLKLGEIIAGNIKTTGEKPKILSLLPEENLIAESVKFFHLPSTLNFHYFLSRDNILMLDSTVNAVTARYRSGGSKSRILLIDYPAESAAIAACESFYENYLPEGEQGSAVRLENGLFTGGVRKGTLLVIHFDAENAENCIELTGKVIKKIRDIKL